MAAARLERQPRAAADPALGYGRSLRRTGWDGSENPCKQATNEDRLQLRIARNEGAPGDAGFRDALQRRYLLSLGGRVGIAAVGRVLVVVALLGADTDLLRLRLLRRSLARLDDLQLQRMVFLVTLRVPLDLHGRARGHLAGQDLVGEQVLDVALDRPAQRPRAHRRVEALVHQKLLGVLGEVELELVLGHLRADAARPSGRRSP